MASLSVHNIGSTLHTMPAAILFSKQVLLTENSSVTPEPQAGDANVDDLLIRATRVTAVLTEIEGYRHGGLND